MNKESSKKIYMTIIKLIAIVVSIFVFSYAWFINSDENIVDTLEVGTARSNNIQVSNTGDEWSSLLDIIPENGFAFSDEVSGDGVNFYKALTKDDNGVPLTYTEAVKNKDYLDFDLWFKNDRTVDLYLDDASVVYPECCNGFSGVKADINNPRENITRVSSYGNFTRDLIAGAVRVAFIKYNYDELTDTYTLEDTPEFIWVPNSKIELKELNGIYDVDLDSENSEQYKYIGLEDSEYVEKTLTNVKTSVLASYQAKTSNGDPKLISIETDNEIEKMGRLKIRIWVEGTDREAKEALRGGKFKFTLSFVGLSKEENNSIPNVVLSEDNIVQGLNGSMEFSLDEGLTWNDVTTTELELTTNSIWVRYKETEKYFASMPAKLELEEGV